MVLVEAMLDADPHENQRDQTGDDEHQLWAFTHNGSSLRLNYGTGWIFKAMAAQDAVSAGVRLETLGAAGVSAPIGFAGGGRVQMRFVDMVTAVATAVLLAALPASAASEDPHAGALDAVEIADPAVALTFGRIEMAQGRRPVLVTAYSEGRVIVIDLVCALGRPLGDAVSVFRAEGYDKLREIAEKPVKYCRRVLDVRTLSLPVDLTAHHIAVGNNYAAPTGAAEVQHEPFLFAKMVQPTGPRAAVSGGDGLLDYQVEIAWVALAPLRKGVYPEHLGMILAIDYTDRETVLHHVDSTDVASGTGFTAGTSFPGYLPVGNLFVIPADYRVFAPTIELRLYVNGERRQDALVSQAIWDIDRIVAETWRRQDRRWRYRGGEVSILAHRNVIAARTMILGGTPSGTVFEGIATGDRIAGVGDWLWGGWDESVADRVVERYARSAREEGRYLQAGDRVVVHVERMGVIDSEVR